MARKKKHEEHANHERWLVSYADFITLLFAFFVVLFSSSQVDKSKTKKMALAIESAFSTFSLFNQTGGQLNIMADPTISGAAGKKSKAGKEEGVPLFIAPSLLIGAKEDQPEVLVGDPALNQGSGVPTSEKDAMSRIKQEVMDLLKMRKGAEKVKVKVDLDSRGIVIGVTSTGAFESGSNRLSVAALELIKGIGEILVREGNAVRVEAHTDNMGDAQTNWHLSTLRSVSVIQWLVDHFNLDPARFEAVGYGQYRPIAPNDTEEGRDQNRRVEIVVLPPKVENTAPENQLPKLKAAEAIVPIDYEREQLKEAMNAEAESLSILKGDAEADAMELEQGKIDSIAPPQLNNLKEELKIPSLKLEKTAEVVPQQQEEVKTPIEQNGTLQDVTTPDSGAAEKAQVADGVPSEAVD